LAFDLIQKYRELASLGEPEATTFIVEWDTAVANSDTSKLTKLEASLLDHAHTKLSMFSAAGLRSLKRLREDRHTSAHPAYISTEELYEPSDELARAHIMAAIEIVLAQKPIRGRGIIESFGADLVSPGFPYDVGASLNYVEQKYLAHMRDATVKNFGTVLAKSLIRENVEEWIPHVQRQLCAMYTIQQRRPDAWSSVQADVIRLINDDVPEHRSNVLVLLSWFPDLFQHLNNATVLALTAQCRDPGTMIAKPRAFHAVFVPALANDVLSSLNSLSRDQQVQILGSGPIRIFWPQVLQHLLSAGSYRGAEQVFDSLIAQYFSQMGPNEVSDVFHAVSSNAQAWNATGMPGRLLAMLDATGVQPRPDAVTALYHATLNGEYMDAVLASRLAQGGWAPPPPPPPPQAEDH